MKTKRLLSFLITFALITSMLICAPASAVGNSKEIFNLNFEDGARLPKFTYGGTEYQTTDSMTKNWLGVRDDVYGRLGDKSLYLTTGTSGGSGVGCQLTVPAVPALQDIGGGMIVLSWDMAVGALEGSNEIWTDVVLYKKVTATGEIKSQTSQIYFTPSTFYWNYGSNHSKKLQTIGSKPENEIWNKFDLILYYGTGKMELYQNGTLLKKDDYVPRTLDTAGGQELTGIGQLNFRVRSKDSTAKSAYIDNIRLRTYESTTVYDQSKISFTEDFQAATKNTVSDAYLSTNSGAVDFDVESGVYGKPSTDQSIKLVKNNIGSGSKEVYYQHTGKGTGYQYGGTVHIGFSLAFDKIEKTIFNKFLQIDPSNSSSTKEKIVELKYGQLVCIEESKPVNWEPGKWYRFDVYVTPGNGSDVMNTVDVYLNGKKMFEDVAMKTASLSRLNPLRIGQVEKVDKFNDVMYIDDVTYDYTPAGITLKYPNVSLSSNSQNISVVDTDTIFVEGNATAADVKAAISVGGGRGYVLSAPNTVADDTANATDCYLCVYTPNGYSYNYPIVNKVVRYDEDFSNHTYSTGEEIPGWERTAPNASKGEIEGEKGGIKGLAGKAETDQSYKNTKGYLIHNYSDSEKPFALEGQKTTIEFSLLMNDTVASENLGFMFKYKDANGDTQGYPDLITLLNLSKNNVNPFTSYKSGQNVTSYSDNQWNKYAIEIDPKAFTANVYVNGKLVMEDAKFMPSSFKSTGCEMLNIYRFKYEHKTTNTEDSDAYSAIDDFKVYLGSYNANADKVSVSSSDYLLNGNWIAITEETDVETFEESISLTNATRTVIFDDKTITSTDIADEDIVMHDQYLAVETPGKAIHYYRIVDQCEDTVLLSKAIYSGSNANSLTEVNSDGALALGTYRAKVAYEKYNNEPENVYLILRSNIIDTPEVMEAVKFTNWELAFGSNEILSDAITVEDTDEQLTAMVWDEDFVPLCEATTAPTQNETPEIPVDKYTTPTTPTVAEIQTALNTSHPRLMVSDFDVLAQSIKSDSVYKKWYYANKNTANENPHSVEYRAQLLAGYKLTNDDGSQLATSTFRDRVILFAFNHMISNRVYSSPSTYYKDKVWQYIEEGNSWSDWGHEDEFLNTADMITAYAVAYDWLYDDWTEEEKATIKDALINKGLNYAKEIFDGNRNDYSSWIGKEHNWTAWCDSAILVGSLAIADENEMGATLANKALADITNCYSCFAPDGAWNEGTGYGEVSLRFLAIALSSLETALSSEFGHKYAQGLSDAGFANLYMFGKNDAFGLNDASGDNQVDFDFYFGKLFNDKYLNGLRYYQLQNLNANATVYDLIWYNNSNLSTNFLTKMPYDKYYSGVQTATMRAGGFLDKTTAFAGLHAGYNNVNHGHLDGGTFAYETNGVRWAVDLGADNYGLHNYFETDEWAQLLGQSRWDYYRVRAEGHNTWVINPSDDEDQVINAQGTITKHSFDNSKTSYSIADLTNFYKSDVSSANRGVMLNKVDGSLIVRDEIALKKSSALYWFMHTEAEVTVNEDGKSAILTQDGRRLWVGIIDGDGTITVKSATPLASSPNPDNWSENGSKKQNANEGVSKLSIEYTGKTGTLNQTVYMVELEDGQTAPDSIPQAKSLANWN